ncbi:MAG: hypothetical protein Q4G22_08065 [Paracoccus sp. (in: a-proteobacteria)]|uniref:hypothetical protein n=1 Tax=Paracoccus sp. TaxID=267 RepID=UPI0026DF9C16|nr:hypothetical protein [Paracoccus sp. (in: a-proteobacteria)]MDO5631778.1 hypothetical protein [Paracoccus sp. (in: a-proteobacteria)]
MLTTVELKGNFDRQDGVSSVSGTLIFTLSQRDFDGSTVIEPAAQTVPLDGEGEFTGVRLWPNERGRMGSTYRVEYQKAGAAKPDLIEPALFVPDSAAPLDLADLLLMNTVARETRLSRIIPISADVFAQRQQAGTLVEALYLVEGEAA